MLLALARNIPQADAAVKGGKWPRERWIGTEVCNKTLGIVGLGNIGTIVAERALGLRMKVIAFDPFVTAEVAARLRVELVSLDEIYARADFITIHTPLTPETRGLIGAATIARMKRGVRLVNCARGGIVHEGDLLAALDAGRVAGAAIDVWSEEPPRSDTLRRLIQHPHVVVTPHLGANSSEAQVNVAVDVARQLVAFRDGELVEFAVNIPVGDPAALATLRPWVGLGDRLGRFCVQLDPEHLARVTVSVAGTIAATDPELLARAVLAGLLDPVMTSPVNLVNAHLVAAERGVAVEVVREAEAAGYQSVLTVVTETAGGRKLIAGTVFDGQPRVVRLRDLNIEFTPEGFVLVLSYEDRPGMVGRIGSKTLGTGLPNAHGTVAPAAAPIPTVLRKFRRDTSMD